MSNAPNPIDQPELPPSWQDRTLDDQELESLAVPTLVSVFRERGAFAKVDDQTIENLQQHMRLLRFRDGEIICREGTAAEWTFVVLTGEAEIVKPAPNGALILINVLQPGDWGGIMGLFGKGVRMARVLARGEVIVQAIEHDQLVRLMEGLQGLSTGLLTSMGQRIGDDATHLSATLQHVRAVGLDDISEHCSPHERLMLDTIRHRVAAAESLEQIMDFVFDSIPHEQEMRMTLAFLEDAGGRVVYHWTRANYGPLLLPDRFEEDLAAGLMVESYRSSKPSTIDDLEDFACNHPFNQGAVKRVKEGLCSCVISPLHVGRRIIGFLIRSSKSLKAFDEHKVLIQQAIADNIGPVVEKAYRIEMLTRANNDYAEVLSFISHELQSPIASIVTDARLMDEGYLGELNERQKKKIGRSIKKGEYLLRMIRSFLNIARIEAGSMVANITAGVDLDLDVVQPELELVESDLEAKNIGVRYTVEDDLPRVGCDPSLLRIAVGNLLRNAINYGRDGRDILVTIGQSNGTGASIVITVWNEGAGFSEAQRSLLFRKFSRLDTPALQKRKGTGIGLYSTSRIMQLHHGLATARSRDGHWAEFKLTLPLPYYRGNA